MADTFYLEMIASTRKFFQGDCEKLIFPAIDGAYGVLPKHEPVVSVMEPGELKFKVDGKWNYAAVGLGFVEIMPNHVVLLTDTIELPEEIDANRANEAKMRAQERLRQNASRIEYHQSKAALARAMSRLKVNARHH